MKFKLLIGALTGLTLAACGAQPTDSLVDNGSGQLKSGVNEALLKDIDQAAANGEITAEQRDSVRSLVQSNLVPEGEDPGDGTGEMSACWNDIVEITRLADCGYGGNNYGSVDAAICRIQFRLCTAMYGYGF